MAFAPLASPFVTCQTSSVADIMKDCTKQDFQLLSCNVKQGKYMATSLVFKGDVVPKDICPAICFLKINREIQFVDWCPTGFKCGTDY